MHKKVSGRHRIRAICYANSKTRSVVSPARRHTRRKVANGASWIRVRARTTNNCNASNHQSPATFYVRSSSAVRPLFVGNCHDRAISEVETQLQANPCSTGLAHAASQLASKPAGKPAGLFNPMHNISVNRTCRKRQSSYLQRYTSP